MVKDWKQLQIFFINFFLYFYFWLHWVFIAKYRLSLDAASGGCSLVAVHGFLIAVASLAIEHMGSGCMGFTSCGSRALECGVSSCGIQALLLHGMRDLSGPGIEPASLALQGRFVATGLPGKSQELRINPPSWWVWGVGRSLQARRRSWC